ncbi:hypothetical protein [Actinoplanes sp. ATCC 53533]|uniref:hypothetical protein n=1 Tax=Actinoplanes sp. ATCC 53533 TaxID=1288362 RepID=UPI000F770A37|nr:hypothetical protein [Actinoplanes sp. ATCC 53533]
MNRLRQPRAPARIVPSRPGLRSHAELTRGWPTVATSATVPSAAVSRRGRSITTTSYAPPGRSATDATAAATAMPGSSDASFSSPARATG